MAIVPPKVGDILTAEWGKQVTVAANRTIRGDVVNTPDGTIVKRARRSIGSKLAVVRDIGDGSKFAVAVQEVRSTGAPGVFEFVGQVEIVSILPGRLSRDFADMVFLGVTFQPSAPLVDVVKRGGTWYAEPLLLWVPQRLPPNIRQTDCFPFVAQP